MIRLKQRREDARAGFNLIEAAIVLGIVGLIVGGIWAAASSAYENMRQQSASKQLLSLVGNIRNFYTNSGTATIDTSVANLSSLGLIPADMLQGGGLRHQWGNTVALTAPTAGQFVVTYNGLPNAPCRNFLVRNVNAMKGSGLVSVTAGGTAINLTNISASATCGTSGDVVFTFTL